METTVKNGIKYPPRVPSNPTPSDQQGTPPEDSEPTITNPHEQYARVLQDAKNACTAELNAVLRKHGFNMVALPQVAVMPDGTPKISASFDLIPTP